MRTLRNHLILYDAECPMCQLYTNAFVSSGMMDANGREAYQRLPEGACPLVDKQRAVNEIALVNLETGTVTYGVDSLCTVLAHNFPLLRPVFNFGLLRWCLRKAYAFVSYNRRVIVPANGEGTYAWQPSFRLHYRLLYLLFTWLTTAAILSAYTPYMDELLPAGPWFREYLICGAQIIFQAVVLLLVQRKKLWDYLGNMMTVSLAGGLLLLLARPVLLLFDAGAATYGIVFIGVAGLMLLEHIRRCRLLQLGWIPSFTWIVFRIGLLWMIFNGVL
ncbi:hypothetical protein [Parasegetibacter sp. NRK P23]|uniref:hypothetical protein n=1 Tax=Parasegetibacter sp. NRK P23 TaxID=2942999 RepID=UPI002042C3BE|nr:hypothetical protein [Parasegetibacter sp. NRK P23]MCM5527256.1 hypothetical protein [Parasegetibacter sp. NRK P23]